MDGRGDPPTTQTAVLVIGLGNPILGDDGVGWQVAEQLGDALQTKRGEKPPSVDVICLSLGGLRLMEHMIGYQRVIIIDAANTGKHPIGTVTSISLEELANPGAGHTSSVHDTTLQDALAIGKMMGAKLPNKVQLVLIEAKIDYEFSEDLSPTIAASIPTARKCIQQILDTWLENPF